MKFKKTILKNGLRIITIPMRDNPTVTVLVLVEAGSKYETKENNGVSHFLEHMCFKGTKNRPTALHISHELDALGSQSNAFTSQEFTGYYAKSKATHVDKLLDIVSDVYLNSLFDEKEIEKEKGVIIDEINLYDDMPHRKVGELFMSLLYGDQPAGWNIAGPRDNIRKMTREDFVKYRKAHYVASATTVVVAGGITEKKVIGRVKELFKDIPTTKNEKKKKVIESQSAPKTLVHFKETDQTHLVLGFRTFGLLSKEISTLTVLAAVLGGGMSSRLFQKIREEMGVGYYVRANHDAYTDHGFLEIAAGVDNKRVGEVIDAMLAEVKKLMLTKVPEQELSKVKEYLIGNMDLELESSDSQAQFAGIQELLKKEVKTSKEQALKLRKVTAGDIQRLAKRIFVEKGLNLALIGPFKDDTEFKKHLVI